MTRLLATLALGASLLVGGVASAATLAVNSTADDLTAGDGQCTLREAILNANADTDSTSGDCSAGTGADEIRLAEGVVLVTDGSLRISGDLEVIGAGADLSVIEFAGSYSRGIVINAGPVVSIQGVEIANAVGFGIDNSAGASLALHSSVISGTQGAPCRARSMFCYGISAAIYSNAPTVVTASALTNNEIALLGGPFEIRNSTISANYMVELPIGESSSIMQSTIADNEVVGGSWQVRASILIDNDNCGGITSLGYNLHDGSCGLSDPTDLLSVDPLLGPLQGNGGTTPTHALLPGSPAIDAIPVTDCTYDDDGDPGTPEVPLTEDQRGVARPQGGGCDIGAYEETVTACADGLDNDGDGLIDHPNDRGCTNALDLSERSRTLICDDGVDNDGDTLIDYPEDPGCYNTVWVSENPQCMDGIDNDGDGLIDYPDDPACVSAFWLIETSQCQDGLDNDDDGLIDFDGGASAGVRPIWRTDPDPECVGRPGGMNEGCGLGAELVLVLAPLMWMWRRRRI